MRADGRAEDAAPQSGGQVVMKRAGQRCRLKADQFIIDVAERAEVVRI